MIAQKWGRIVNVTTSYSTMMREGNTPYGQAKAAMEAASALYSCGAGPNNCCWITSEKPCSAFTGVRNSCSS